MRWPQSPRDVADTIWNVFLADQMRDKGSDRARTLLANFTQNWPKQWSDQVKRILKARREGYERQERKAAQSRREGRGEVSMPPVPKNRSL